MHPLFFFYALVGIALLLGITRAVQRRHERYRDSFDLPPTDRRKASWQADVKKYNESLRQRPELRDRDGSSRD